MHFGKGALAAAEVRSFLKALHADGGDEVLDPQHLIGKFFIDQGAVREGEEHAVTVLFAQRDDILFPDQRLTAGIEEHPQPQFLRLGDDGIQRVKIHVQAIAVLRGPAAGAVQIAGAGGIHQDGPGDVAAVLFHGGLSAGGPQEVGIDHEVFKKRPADVVVDIRPKAFDQTGPVVVRIRQGGADGLAVPLVRIGAVQFVRQIHQLGNIGFRVLIQVCIGLFDRGNLQTFLDGHIENSFRITDVPFIKTIAAFLMVIL